MCCDSVACGLFSKPPAYPTLSLLKVPVNLQPVSGVHALGMLLIVLADFCEDTWETRFYPNVAISIIEPIPTVVPYSISVGRGNSLRVYSPDTQLYRLVRCGFQIDDTK